MVKFVSLLTYKVLAKYAQSTICSLHNPGKVHKYVKQVVGVSWQSLLRLPLSSIHLLLLLQIGAKIPTNTVVYENIASAL